MMMLREILDYREVLADFTSEQISPEEFVSEWQTMKEVDKGQEAELSDLVDVLGNWGSGGGLDVEMS
jgi:hypothetical protein